MKTEYRTILFVPHFDYSFYDMLPVALLMKDKYGYGIHFGIEWPITNNVIIKECKKHGFTCSRIRLSNYNGAKKRSDTSVNDNQQNGLNHWKAVKNIPICSELANLGWQFIHQYTMKIRVKKLIRDICPSVVVVYRDDRLKPSTFITHIANKEGIPTVLFPSVIVFPKMEEARECVEKGYSISRYLFFKKLLYLIARLLIPNLTYKYNEEEASFFPPEAALIAHFNGVFPRDPWVRGGGKAHWVAVATPNDYELVIKEGLSQERLFMTGFPPHDRFYKIDQTSIRETLCKTLNIPENRFIICYAALPLQNGKEAFCPVSYNEFRSREQFLVDELLKMAPDIHIIFKLHPKSYSDEYNFLPIHHPRLTIIRDMEIDEAIVGCDLFGTYCSSAIFDALAFRKPIFSFGYPNDPNSDIITGFLNPNYQARTREEFVLAAQFAINDTRSNRFNWQLNGKDAEKYYTGDGKSTIRFANLVYALAVNPKGDAVKRNSVMPNA